MRKTVGYTQDAPAPSGRFSQSLRIGDLVTVSGQYGVDPKTAQLAGTDVTSQVHQTMRNIEACLACHGGTLKDVVRVEVYLKDLGDFDAMNAAYRTHFAEPLPTRATIGAGLVGDILVEIVVMALLGEERGGRP